MTQQELHTILQSGEGYKIEFKRNVNTDLSKELVAFANASGGRILIGIDDDGSMPGVTIDNSLKSKVEMMARDCDPAVVISTEAVSSILVIDVPEGKAKPYRCTGGFYLRNGASSVKLSTEEIRDFFAAEGKVHFDEMLSRLTYADLDEDLVKRYMELSGIDKTIDREGLLFNMGVLDKEDGVRVNNTGLLFFHRHPVRYLPQSAVTCVAYKGIAKVDVIDKKTFELHLIGNIDEAMAFLKRHLNLSYEIKSKRRVEKLEIPEVALREAIVNAVAHRNYLEKGATVMVEVFDDRIEISNPGGLPKGLKEEDFGKRTLARNPLIAALLHRAKYIEKLGTGIQRMRQEMTAAGLPEPHFHFGSFFTIVLKRLYAPEKAFAVSLAVSPARLERMMYLVRELQNGGPLDIKKAALKFKVGELSIRKDLQYLDSKGWVVASGKTSNRAYRISEQGLKQLNFFG